MKATWAAVPLQSNDAYFAGKVRATGARKPRREAGAFGIQVTAPGNYRPAPEPGAGVNVDPLGEVLI